MRHLVRVAVRLSLDAKYRQEFFAIYKKRRATSRRRYKSYISWYDTHILSTAQKEQQIKDAAELQYRPLISILLPTYNTVPSHLRSCIESVVNQTYDNWELCISDDASTKQGTVDVIKEYERTHSNIHAVYSNANGHIAVSSNRALKIAKGEFISLLDHDDLLTPDALFETVRALQNDTIDLVYSDEDKIDHTGIHIEPFFKPDWSPDFLNSCNVITHFATIRADIMRKVGGFTPGTHGAQDWDLFLKVTSLTDRVYHVPKILYHWRKSETSTAQNAKSKPYAYVNQGKVLRQSIARKKENAYAKAHPALGFWRKQYVIDGHPLVSIIIPSKDCYEHIVRSVESIIEKTTYPYFEIVIVDTGSEDERVKQFYERICADNKNIKIVKYAKKTFNFSDACNYGVSNSEGEFLLFLNNDTKVITRNWVQSLLEHAQRPEVGMVGAKLYFPSGNIQHAGVVMTKQDIAFHPFYNQHPAEDIFSYIYIANIRNVSAVTAACSMVSRNKFEEVGGFDRKLRVTYNDIDLNLKLRKKGYLNIYTPYAELTHYESVSVGKITTAERDATELHDAQELMRKRWGAYLERDPYYNDNFLQHGPGYRLPE